MYADSIGSPLRPAEYNSRSPSPVRVDRAKPEEVLASIKAKPVIPALPASELMTVDSRYKCRGIRVRFHYALTSKNYEKFSLKCTLKNSKGVIDNNNGEPCEN